MSVGTNSTNALKIGKKIRPVLTDYTIIARITKLSNFLFQTTPYIEELFSQETNHQQLNQ